MNVKLRQKKFEKDFFKLINNAVSGKTMENVKKHRNISNRYEKTQILMNKPVYLGLFLLDLSKTVL